MYSVIVVLLIVCLLQSVFSYHNDGCCNCCCNCCGCDRDRPPYPRIPSRSPTSYPTNDASNITPCGIEIRKDGDIKPTTLFYDVGKSQGQFKLTYETYKAQDQILVFKDGNIIYDSGCTGTDGEMNQMIDFDSGPDNSQIIRITIKPGCLCDVNNRDTDPRCKGTAWYLKVGCSV